MTPQLALMLGGGGARAAYQVGVLRGLMRSFPSIRFPIMTGISAGAINTMLIAADSDPLPVIADRLADTWKSLHPEMVYDLRASVLIGNVIRSGLRLISGDVGTRNEPIKGMLDTQPLRKLLERYLEHDEQGFLPGIERNLDAGSLRAVALSATSYTTGRSITWIEGRGVEPWQRTDRRSELTRLTAEHVMASSALPMLFPAVRVGSEWYGDGGIRLTAPLSPALNLGATHIFAISTRSPKTDGVPVAVPPYPSPAQILGVLYSAVFLDLLDDDIRRLQMVNRMLETLPIDRREGMRVVNIIVMRPSVDLGSLAQDFESNLPKVFRYLIRGLGTRRTARPDLLSVLLFESGYVDRLIQLGESDVAARREAIQAFLNVFETQHLLEPTRKTAAS